MRDSHYDALHNPNRPTHACAGGCGTQLAGNKKWCFDCGVEVANKRRNASKTRRRRAKRAGIT